MKLKNLIGGLWGALALTCGALQASPINLAHYEMIFRVDSVQQWQPCDDTRSAVFSFGCISVGDVFRGGFAVDERILATDGVVNNSPVFNFRLPFGNALFSTDAENTALDIFRNEYGLNLDGPGFVIEGGEVVGLAGGVAGRDDFIFIDFGRNVYFAADQDGRMGFVTWAHGRLTLNRIPEPSELLLLSLSLVVLASFGRRKSSPFCGRATL